ncbi:MAG: ABC transporter permease [Gemmatimonadetes bacterium]|nr:ABC transporter permease [Gemmatimonadota bacterium]
MIAAETVGVALDALRANKMRSLLTMLGIVIGVSAVIAMVALGTGAANAVRERIARLGTTVLQVNAVRLQQGGVTTASTAKLTMKDVDAVVERSHNVVAVNPQQDRTLQVQWTNRNANIQVTGTMPNFLDVRGFRIASGRMFTRAEEAARKNVAVLGGTVAPLLGFDDGASLIGERIRIGGLTFTVIGVLAEKGTTGFGDGDEQVLIPFSTGRFRVFGTDRVNDIWALAASEDSLESAMAEVQAAIRRSHRIRPGRPDDFRIRNQSDFLVALSETNATFAMLLAGVAAVSLLVGGIGIMNIMLVAVTERTREIGVRKALGATRRDILLQFLIEAVVLCVVGGLIGVAVGVIATWQLHVSLGWETAVDPVSILVAVGFATATGLIFGVWPARRAAKLDPIVALRFE